MTLKNKMLVNGIRFRCFLMGKKLPLTDEEILESITLYKIRKHLEALGVDTSDFTNEDLKNGISALSDAVTSFGISAKELGNNLNKALNKL